jgi:signal transduction histidine kinase
MDKRMLKLNGSFEINSIENNGTSLKFAIPL